VKRKGRVTLAVLLAVVIAVLAGDYMLTMTPAGDTGEIGQWPSKVEGPSCQAIARERHIPADLADHTCEAIRS